MHHSEHNILINVVYCSADELLEKYGSKLLPSSPGTNFEPSEKPQQILSRWAMQRLNVPDGSALLRTFNQDVQLLPPTHSGGQQQAPRFTWYGFLEHQVGFQGIGMDRLNLLVSWLYFPC
jgi:hypothetical protein